MATGGREEPLQTHHHPLQLLPGDPLASRKSLLSVPLLPLGTRLELSGVGKAEGDLSPAGAGGRHLSP